jgi:hypothetical protein
MRDLPAPEDPFFSTAAGTARCPYHRTINTPQLVIDLASFDPLDLQSRKDPIESPVAVPFVEKIPGSSPRTELFREVSPWRPCTKNPENRVNDLTTFSRWTAGPSRRGEEIFDPIPLLIREAVSQHPIVLLTTIHPGRHSVRK